MKIKKIKIENYKSFKNLEVELGNLNVLIGPNAGGKTNFISIFRFLRKASEGLDKALSSEGGFDFLKNFKANGDEGISIEMEISLESRTEEFEFNNEEDEIPKRFRVRLPGLIQFSYNLKNNENETSITIKNFSIEEIYRAGRYIEKPIWEGNLELEAYFDKISFESLEKKFKNSRWLTLKVLEFILDYSLPLLDLKIFDRNFGIYDFDTKTMKQAYTRLDESDLKSDGSNLVAFLEKILSNEIKRKKLLNLIGYVLDFIEDVKVKRSIFDYFSFELKEKFDEKYLPSFLVSDGTVRVLAVIVALYFQNKSFVIFEEPERNIHPYLLSRIVDLFKEASKEKQILITTHNPEFLKYIDLENILVVSRDEDGFSTVKRLSEIEDIKFFLKNEIGVDELLVGNLLK
ncbi:MAG: AAA family ATPase [candidate division WOR-3 bacterium]